MTEGDFIKMVKEHEQSMRVYCAKLTRFKSQVVAADDLYCEYLAKFWINRKKWDSSKGTFKTWAYRVTLNIYLDHYRRSKATKYEHQDIDVLPHFDHVVVPTCTEHTMSIHAVLDVIKEILSGWSELAQRHFEWFRMHEIGFKYDELAVMYNKPLGTIKGSINRAKTRMRNELKAVEIDWPNI